MNTLVISEKEFKNISQLLKDETGINIPMSKKYLVYNRLINRIKNLKLGSFARYLDYVFNNNENEFQEMINNLTTNETFFFRESKHFDDIKSIIHDDFIDDDRIRIWSAACATGEEVYSIAMTLDSFMHHSNWEVIGSDINSNVLNVAGKGVYKMKGIKHIPGEYLKKYCMKGVRSNEGNFIISNRIRNKIKFMKINLHKKIKPMGKFNIIFLRNTLIYFDDKTKIIVLKNVIKHLKKGGYLIVSHTENLMGLGKKLKIVRKSSSIYRKNDE